MEGIKIGGFEEKNEKIRDQENYENSKFEVFNLLQKFVEEGSRKIGKGLSAEVHYYGENKKACVKIISDKTLDSTRKINSSIEEADFQERAFDLIDDVEGVIVPKPYFEHEFKNETGDVTEELNVMCMERLNAVSLEEILDYKKDLPTSFNFENFFNNLKKGITRLHENNIHHRDLRPGNVMVDLETGNPCIIDFGLSVESIGEDDPYKEFGVDGVKVYPSDESEMRKLRQLMMKFVLEKSKRK